MYLFIYYQGKKYNMLLTNDLQEINTINKLKIEKYRKEQFYLFHADIYR